MLRVIKRDFKNADSDATVTVGLERSRSGVYAGLSAALPPGSEKEFDTIARLLATDKGRLVLFPKGGIHGPVVRIDCLPIKPGGRQVEFDGPTIQLVDVDVPIENGFVIGEGLARR